MNPKKNILILAPHTDDGELGCGATIAKYIENGYTVSYIAFSICEESVPDGFLENILEIEVKNATQKLGINPSDLYIEYFKVRKFPQYRQEILERLVHYNKLLKPDIVFMPSSFDVHQDHSTIHSEGLRAFKTKTILGYEFMWNNYSFSSSSFSIVEERHINAKITALEEYKSQAKRFYAGTDLVKGQAQFRGLQIGKKYAEAFEVIRWIM